LAELRGARYGEIFLITSNQGQLMAAVYNTTGLNDCPAATWRSLDPRELAKDFGVPAVYLNGPQFWWRAKRTYSKTNCRTSFGLTTLGSRSTRSALTSPSTSLPHLIETSR
jgi:hypothetical protein